jgi:hypothetical protein
MLSGRCPSPHKDVHGANNSTMLTHALIIQYIPFGKKVVTWYMVECQNIVLKKYNQLLNTFAPSENFTFVIRGVVVKGTGSP